MNKDRQRERQGQEKRTEEKKKQERAGQIVYFCYVCLIYGIILLFGDMGKFSYYRLVVLGSSLFVSRILWFGWLSSGIRFSRKNGKNERGKNERIKAAIILVVLYAVYFFIRREMLDEQFYAMLLCLTKMEKSTEDFTLLFSALSFLLSLIFFFVVFLLKKGWFVYGITLPILFLGPMFGYRPSWFGLFLLVIFHIGDGIYHAVYQQWNDEPEEKNNRAVVLEKGVLAAVLVVLLSFFLACLIPKGSRKEWMKGSVQFAHTWRTTVSNNSSITVEGPSGKISRGNYYSSGTRQLEISLSEKPEERIYLKSFTGGEYKGDEWTEAEESDFSPLSAVPQKESIPYLPPAYFEWRQFQMIQYGKMEDGKDSASYPWPSREYQDGSEMMEMKIHPINRWQKTFLVPYLSAYVSQDSDDGYRFFLFSWEDYEQYQQRLNEKYLQWFDQLEEPYREYVNQHYLEVPEEKLLRLLALCREHPLEKPEEIAVFIRRTLAQYAAYSRTPGFMPYGTDIAEYFLFDGQEGYCQHFATAAVLMFRMYGIPARYAAGYIAEPGDFLPGQDGLYYANLTDRKAHAWAEIYLGGPGWIPVEVTPVSEEGENSGAGTDQTGENSGAGMDQTEGQAEMTQTQDAEKNNLWLNGENLLEEKIEKETEHDKESVFDEIRGIENRENNEDFLHESQEETWKSELDLPDDGSPGENNAEGYTKGRSGRGKGICTAAVLFLAGAVWAVKQQTRKKREYSGADEAYKKIVELLHLGGYLTEFDGTEPDFPHAAAKACAQMNQQRRKKDDGLSEFLSQNEIKKIKAYAFQTAYGREISSDRERKRVIEAYQQVYTMLIKSVKGINKLKIAVQAAVLVWKK